MTPEEHVQACIESWYMRPIESMAGEDQKKYVAMWVAAFRDAIAEERERCARIAENMKIVGGIHIGPLFNAGWDGCARETAKKIRANDSTEK